MLTLSNELGDYDEDDDDNDGDGEFNLESGFQLTVLNSSWFHETVLRQRRLLYQANWWDGKSRAQAPQEE